MNINEAFELLLSEGVHDKGIFKAVFLTGGPGSGKDYVLKHSLSKHGLVEIGADKAHDYLSDPAHNFNKTSPEDTPAVNKKIKSVSELRQLLALHGRNGVIINGTGHDHKHTKHIKKSLEKLGYDTSMVHVHTDDEISRKRNIERSQRGGRSMPESQRKGKWDAVQEARRHHAQMFGSNYHEFDNTEDLRNATPEVVKKKKDELNDIHEKIKSFVGTQPASERSQTWISKQLKTSGTDGVPRKGTHKLPHPDSVAGHQAIEAGLTYHGNGKYGKNGKHTHHVINDNLVEIEKDEKKVKVKPKKLTEFFSESVSVTVTGDTAEEVTNLLSKLGSPSPEKDEYALSDKQDSLTLGKKTEPIGTSNEGVTISNSDVSKIMTENVILDNYGKPKIYLMKTMALKDASLNEGVVCLNDNGKGYIVKLKGGGNENTRMVEENILQEREGTREDGTSIKLLTESKEEISVCQKKPTLSELRKRFIESIDKGIEPGLSMATSGENLGRPTKEKVKKDGTIGTIEELTGDETTASIGDQKEDELKKKGISLLSLKSKRVM